jgi:hypothetical protein
MLFRPPRRGLVRLMLQLATRMHVRPRSNAQDHADLDRLSATALERDLGLVRSPDRRYRPY